MFSTIRKPRVAVFGLTLELYDDAFPGYMERLSRQLDEFLGELDAGAEILSRRVCFCRDHVEEEVRQAEATAADALLLLPLSYTASLTSLQPLLRTRLPVVIWNTQQAVGFDTSYSYDDLLMNHVTQGTQDVTNVLTRSGRTFGMESGHYRDARALARLTQWLDAAKTAEFAKRMRVGLLGQPFQDMGDFGVDETRMAAEWGPHTVHLSPGRFARFIEDVDAGAVDERMAQDRDRFEITDEVTDEIRRTSVRLELGLRRLVSESELDAFSMNFRELVEDGRFPTLPFFGLNQLLAEGLGYAGEGNTTIAAHMAQLRQLCGIANFTEVFTVDYEQNRMLMTHMQECNPALARTDSPVRLVKKEFWAPGIGPYVGMVFTLEPGPVTLTNVTTDEHGRLFYIVYETRIVDMAPLPKLDIPHWVVELDEPVGEFLTRYSMAGGTHHLATVPGHQADAVRKLAHIQGFRLVEL